MKYRKLNVDELEPLKDEFISFLSANGIDATLWAKYKVSSLEVVDDLITQFSDLVFEKICTKIDYLHLESNNLSASYHVKNDHTTMVAIELKSILENFPENGNVSNFESQEESDIHVYKLSKQHKEDRNKEVYNLLELGCLKSDGTKYKEMILQWAATKAT
jgi:hypothetical protein